MAEMVKGILGSLLRKAILALGVWLTAKGIGTEADWANVAQAVVGLSVVLIPVAWSVAKRIIEHFKSK